MIIQSLIDLDFYKLTMGQLAFHSFPNVIVEYAFRNRTKFRLAEIISIDRLREEIEHVKTLSLNREQIEFLRGRRLFSESYLEFLSKINVDVPLSDVKVEVIDGQFSITTTGTWPIAIFWETIILSIVNELYYISKYGDISYIKGLDNLSEKIKTLRSYPGLKFSDFGTRRRASREWQALVINRLRNTLPSTQFIGTSNVQFAMDYSIDPIGTFAHELPMIASGIWYDTDVELKESHGRILDMWRDLYGDKLLLALTDTFGSRFFFEDFGIERATTWNGLRHDSGDAVEFGEKTIGYYNSLGIDPMTKTIVFSDGLNIESIIKLYLIFNGRINVIFGWGTTLTNDLGYETLSIVMKAVVANGNGLVKLSDNLIKATGTEQNIARYKNVYGYTNVESKDCVV